ncbi:MAG: ATP-dependent helicase [Propionibacteriaceae bacterium]|jgi:DNA polymerase III epsilon subunit-like protein/superfamily II DNA or RNA helicase|nr:ATP-dependent helicase [Propionibacteriaceae bacterium]
MTPFRGFAVIDVETNGLSPSRNRILEIAVVGLDPRLHDEWAWVTLVNPLTTALGRTDIHHIREQDVRLAPTFAQLAGNLVNVLRGRILVAHNTDFDVGFLGEEFLRLGVNFPTVPGLDTLDIAKHQWPGRTVTLDACCRYAGVPRREAHSALGDALATADLLRYLLRSMDPTTRPDLDRAARWAAGIDWPALPADHVALVKRGAADSLPPGHVLLPAVAAPGPTEAPPARDPAPPRRPLFPVPPRVAPQLQEAAASRVPPELRQRLQSLCDEAAALVAGIRLALGHCDAIEAEAAQAEAGLRRRLVSVPHTAAPVWNILVLTPEDGPQLGRLMRAGMLSPLPRATRDALESLATDLARTVDRAREILRVDNQWPAGRRLSDEAQAAADYLAARVREAADNGLRTALEVLTRDSMTLAHVTVPLDTAHDWAELARRLSDPADWSGFARRFADLGHPSPVIQATRLRQLAHAVDTCLAPRRDMEARRRAAAVAAGDAVRRVDTRDVLAQMPVQKLRDTAPDRLRLEPLLASGVTTVQQVLDLGPELQTLPGVGPATATRLLGAAETMRQAVLAESSVRLDIRTRSEATTDFLRQLRAWDLARKAPPEDHALDWAQEFEPLTRSLSTSAGHAFVWTAGRFSLDAFDQIVSTLVSEAAVLSGEKTDAVDPWDDFLERPSDYFALMSELGFLAEDEAKSTGDLPEEIVAAVRSFALDTQALHASLRGYQSFGARFALVQGKVILGDEMGLGKTVEAIAVLAHLAVHGGRRGLVVCPAAVVTNWTREIASKSALTPYRVHGPERAGAAERWAAGGGVAVTTFETLAWWLADGPGIPPQLDCVIVDEAHYIKSPNTRRTKLTRSLLEIADRAVLLTGTPLENKTEEFGHLVRYLRPDLLVDTDGLSPRQFRRQVAPCYLRRNQEDVLTELPELIETEEWVPMSHTDSVAYRRAVVSGNFMEMRQAAMLGTSSGKIKRLQEIVQEAEDNGRRVIVFSHFLAVLQRVVAALSGHRVHGPLTGSVAASARQAMVDQFSADAPGSVLVAQIVAGGVGLNIQAASVVIICEPQLKPTTEWQAIARAHRMGQLEAVQVHRLLSDEGVDGRVVELLQRKERLFEDFARVSEITAHAPEAFDVSDAELARQIVAAEQARLLAPSPADPSHHGQPSTE